MTIGAKIWLWILLISNALTLFYLFGNDAEMIAIVQMFLNLAAISLMLFLKMRAGFFLLCILALVDLFFNLRLLSALGWIFFSISGFCQHLVSSFLFPLPLDWDSGSALHGYV